jgi:hypothetical protein
MHYLCHRCGSSEVRFSRHRKLLDFPLALVLLVPLRCRQCAHRFFRFRLWTPKQLFRSWMWLVPLIVAGAWFAETRARPRPTAATTRGPRSKLVGGVANDLDKVVRQRQELKADPPGH